jgi:3-isopropylmalate dehydratase
MPGADKKPKTLYDKVFQDHIVNEQDDGTILLYIGMLGSSFFVRINFH